MSIGGETAWTGKGNILASGPVPRTLERFITVGQMTELLSCCIYLGSATRMTPVTWTTPRGETRF